MFKEGINFITFSDKIAPAGFKFTLITFYITVVYAIGKVLRSAMTVPTPSLFIRDIPRPDQLLLLIECIHIYRSQQNLEKEEELYFLLIEILRRTELIGATTGSSLKFKQEPV